MRVLHVDEYEDSLAVQPLLEETEEPLEDEEESLEDDLPVEELEDDDEPEDDLEDE